MFPQSRNKFRRQKLTGGDKWVPACRNATVKILLICSVCVLGWGVPSTVAQEMYTYTGNPYHYCSGTYAVSVNGSIDCAGAYSVTGSFATTLSLSQLENLNDFVIPNADISSFSFSDGSGLTIDQYNATPASTYFEITTNSFGNIIGAPPGKVGSSHQAPQMVSSAHTAPHQVRTFRKRQQDTDEQHSRIQAYGKAPRQHPNYPPLSFSGQA